MEKYDFSGWATRNDILCTDGRIIRRNAFKCNDGTTVPLVWNHCHTDPSNVLGHALLENREEGVYAYCVFNDSEKGQDAKEAVRHGDVKSLSIYANKLKQDGNNVLHGTIRELSLVFAGANEGAFIDSVMMHADDTNEGVIASYDENIMIHHYVEPEQEVVTETDEAIEHSDNKKEENTTMANSTEEKKVETKEEVKEEPKTESKENTESKEKTVQDVFDEFTDEQKNVVFAIVGELLKEAEESDDDEETKNVKHSEGGNEIMSHNVFDREAEMATNTLTHSDEVAIMELARSVGSFNKAVEMYAKDHLQHGFGTEDEGTESIDVLFRDLKNVPEGAPTLLERDMDWVAQVMSKANKSPIARVRTRQIDARVAELTAKAHKKGSMKTNAANVKLLKRETNPQTVYIKDSLHRDDVLDMDFDAVSYMRNIMKHTLEETIALAALVGDIRNSDEDKISDECIRPIWTDKELYAIHGVVDVEGMGKKLQGTNTAANFGEEFIYAEAIIAALLDKRIQYKGKGTPDFYCTPQMLNKVLMARDMNGRRIYDSAADFAKVLNVGKIFTVEQFNELSAREDDNGKKFNLVGIFVNMNNYQFGCAKGGEVTNFEDFDIDYNQYKYLMETRLSGALIDPYSAIVLEIPADEAAG